MVREKKKSYRTVTGNTETRYSAGLRQLNKKESTTFGPPEKALLPASSVIVPN